MPKQEITITVNVPADAKVYINDRLTTSTGVHRQFVSPALEPGLTYEYDLRAEYIRDGEEILEKETARLKAGEKITMRFPRSGRIARAE